MDLAIAGDPGLATARALRLLADCGWLTAEESRGGSVRVDSARSSHELHRVRVGDRAAVVKLAAAGAGPQGRSLRAELCAYRMSRWIAPLADILPTAIAIDERQQALAMACLSMDPVWPHAQNAAEPLSDPQVLELGAAMAQWHRATLDLPLEGSPAYGILGLPADVAFAGRDRPEATRRLMASIAADAALASVLTRAADRYRPRCLIHGDLRRENLMVDAQGALKVIDWDLSGAGDPAWDVGSVVAQLLLEPARLQLATASRPKLEPWPAEVSAAVLAFLAAYAAEGGPIDLQDPDELGHVLDCAFARLLHIACEWSDWDANEAHSAALVTLAGAMRPAAGAALAPTRAATA